MQISYSQENKGNGICFSEAYDKKFKTNLVTVRFITKLDKNITPLYSLLVTILGTSNSKLKTRTALNMELLSLYDSKLGDFSYAVGDCLVTGMNVGYIGDSYTLDKEVISHKLVRILLDCLFEPDIENGKFNEKYFKQKKDEMIEAVKCEINDKRNFAQLRASGFIYEGEPAAVYENGTVEQLEDITQEQLVNAYKNLIENSSIDVSIVGCEENKYIKEMIFEELSKHKRNCSENISFKAPSVIKPEPELIAENYDVSQAKMILAFKTDNDDFYSHKLMCAIFGGTPFSQLFANVREKMSLCYYCSSSIVECKNTMIVDSAVDFDNVEKAKEEILRQLELVANGEFSDDMFENTKKYLYSGFKSNYDSIASINSWLFTQRIRGSDYMPDDVNKIISEISRERVVQSAKSFKLDTVYVMQSEVK
ncbi:MAG: EF-P 5-aminopentanol modification-associated protein YfmF [Oscillospiraceae bacterium]